VSIWISFVSDSAGYLAAAETTGTDMYMAGGAVNDSLYTLYVGLPSPVAAPVGVADLDAERNTLAAKITLGHLLHLLALLIIE